MGPKSERVYRTIREWITTGKYLPGSKIPSERTLSEELDIGRTALRQVLAKLVAEGAIVRCMAAAPTGCRIGL
jgi:DNA-binding GntR family transcriptional regulator